MINFWRELQELYKPILILAPLDGVTDFVFREIISEIAKPDVFYTEFTNTDALFSKGYEKTIPRLTFSQKQLPIVAQIWGINPNNFYKAATLIHSLGFTGIDINMGCPDKTVMKMGSGASHIKNLSLSSEIIQATKEGAMGLSVSVKTRLGIDSLITEEWTSFLLNQKLDAITIHGRTVQELSKVPAHWDEIAKVVLLRDQISPHTVIIGNGDITSIEEAKKVSTTYGVDGVMIGRGIFSNPWVFDRTVKKHTAYEHLQLLMYHATRCRQAYGDTQNFNTFKKFIKIYVKSFRGANILKQQLMDTKEYSQIEKLVSPYLNDRKLKKS